MQLKSEGLSFARSDIWREIKVAERQLAVLESQPGPQCSSQLSCPPSASVCLDAKQGGLNQLDPKITSCWEFSGGPVVRTLCFDCQGPRFNPWHGQKKRKSLPGLIFDDLFIHDLASGCCPIWDPFLVLHKRPQQDRVMSEVLPGMKTPRPSLVEHQPSLCLSGT